jgi:hypothetical protein
MKQIVLSLYIRVVIIFGTIFFSSIDLYAFSSMDSLLEKRLELLGEKIKDQVNRNNSLIAKGNRDSVNYLLFDDPSRDEDKRFFSSFTSDDARDLWVKHRAFKQALTNDDFRNLNKWINSLKATYQNNSKYNDVEVYFVVSGVYNYDNVEDKTGKNYDWSEVRSTSFDKGIKKNEEAGFNAKDLSILYSIYNKVINTKNGNLTWGKAYKKEKYIVCFLFNLYKRFPDQSGSQIEKSSKGEDFKLKDNSIIKMFLVPGYFYNGIDGQVIKGMSAYASRHLNSKNLDNPEDATDRSDYLSQFIGNTYLYFASASGIGLEKAICDDDKALEDMITKLYQTTLPDASKDIQYALKDLPFDARVCLLRRLSEATYCGDASNWIFNVGFCENLTIDLIKSTPDEQQEKLLDTLNGNTNILKGLVQRLDDEGAGGSNFTALIQTLSQFAFNKYFNNPSKMVISGIITDPLTYNPLDVYGPYSKKVRDTYTAKEDGNTITIEFKEHSSLPGLTADGSTVFDDVKRELSPFTFIAIRPVIDLPFKFIDQNNQQNQLNQPILVPALMLMWSIEKSGTKEFIDGLNIAINVGSSVGGLSAFGRTGYYVYKTLSTAQVLTTSVNVLANTEEFKRDILSKEGGQEFLSTVNNINNISVSASLTFDAILSLNKAVLYWRNYSPIASKLVSTTKYSESIKVVDAQIGYLKDAMERDRIFNPNEITFATKEAETETLVKVLTAADYADDAAHMSEVAIAMGEGDVNIVKGWLNAKLNKTDKIYIIIHGGGTEFSVLHNGVDEVLKHGSIVRWLKDNSTIISDKEIIWLSCGDLKAAQNVCNKYGSEIIACQGKVIVYENAAIETENGLMRMKPYKSPEPVDVKIGSGMEPEGELVVLGMAGDEANALSKTLPEGERIKIKLADESLLGTGGNTLKMDLVNEAGEKIGELKRVNRQRNTVGYVFTDNIGGNGVVKNAKNDTKCVFEVMTSEHPGAPLPPGVTTFYADMNIPINVNKKFAGLGKLMYDDAFAYLSQKNTFDGIYDFYLVDADLYGAWGGESINYTQFMDAIKSGLTKEKAAFKTIGGKWAESKGFTKPVFLGDEKVIDQIHILFTK